MADHPAAVGFLRGLRIATLAITAVITFGLSLPTLLTSLAVYPFPAVQVGGYLALAVLIGVAAGLIRTNRTWGRWRWPVVVTVLAIAAASRLSLPPGRPLPIGDWSYGEVGWVGLLLLFDMPLGVFAAFVAVYVLLSFAILTQATALDRELLLAFGLSSVAICTFQMAVGGAGVALRGVAASALVAARQEERVRTAQAVAGSLHEDRLRSYEEIGRTARPLLAALADGSADPAEPGFRRRCAIEAARMRRLFAESDDADDPLLHELGACIEAAERRGVVVGLATRGTWPVLSRELRRALTDAPLAALATAASTARVTVVGTSAGVSVSVMTDGTGADLTLGDGPPSVEVRTVDEDDQLWVEARWKTV